MAAETRATRCHPYVKCFGFAGMALMRCCVSVSKRQQHNRKTAYRHQAQQAKQ